MTIDDTTVTFPPFEFANSIRNAVLARYYNNSYGYIWKGFIRKFKVTRGGEVICDLLPAKNESDEAGLYDLISGNFYRATSETLVAGDEVNDYEPAVVGDPEVLTVGTQTATVPDLYAVGDYRDEVDLVSGPVTRRVRRKVLTGEESVGLVSAATYYGRIRVDDPQMPTAARNQAVSTHFVWVEGTHPERTLGSVWCGWYGGEQYLYFTPTDQTLNTGEKIKAWLAAQYAAGTPVIIWYPLATPTIESVTPQALRTQDGTTIVSSSAGNVGATVEYKASEEPTAAEPASGLMMARPTGEDGGAADGS